MPADYRVVAEALRQQIRSGALAPGARVPGVRALAGVHGTNHDTAAAAIRALAAEGWVIVEPRHATRVALAAPDEPPTVAELAARVAHLEQRVDDLEQRGDEGPTRQG